MILNKSKKIRKRLMVKEKEEFELKCQLYIFKNEEDENKVYYYLFHRKRNGNSNDLYVKIVTARVQLY
jgi:hypothetical protein